jgi:GH15 family glucan-1,4-alpha-glucosidase
MIERYPEISEHGLIGDLQTVALVSTDGSVEWLCCLRFDSPSIFGSVLDHDPCGAVWRGRAWGHCEYGC